MCQGFHMSRCFNMSIYQCFNINFNVLVYQRIINPLQYWFLDISMPWYNLMTYQCIDIYTVQFFISHVKEPIYQCLDTSVPWYINTFMYQGPNIYTSINLNKSTVYTVYTVSMYQCLICHDISNPYCINFPIMFFIWTHAQLHIAHWWFCCLGSQSFVLSLPL